MLASHLNEISYHEAHYFGIHDQLLGNLILSHHYICNPMNAPIAKCRTIVALITVAWFTCKLKNNLRITCLLHAYL